MEILHPLPIDRPRLKAILFDFDGTISTLRYGWEGVMEPLMIEMISGSSTADDEVVQEVKRYIDESTGIQTIYQMQWLAEKVAKYGKNPNASKDPWWYKAEYNRRLMESVEKRITSVFMGQSTAEHYLVGGSKRFLNALKDSDIALYVASGTDHPDVVREAETLGVKEYFKDIAGAPVGKASCSKEAVLRNLLENQGYKGLELAVIGDGRVEIALGREFGAITLGLASDEENLFGVNPTKRERLIRAGAHAIIGDFINMDAIMQWLQI